MSSVVIAGDTSGTITLQAPAVAGSNTLTLPAATGTLLVPGNASPLVTGTAIATTSGTIAEYLSIPSWVRRITWALNGFSFTSTSSPLFQLGTSSGYVTSGYLSYYTYCGASNAAGSGTASNGFLIGTGNAANLHYGHMTFSYVSANVWVCSSNVSINGSGTYYTFFTGGSVSLPGVLDRVRLTSTSGTDAFDAGSVNILYE